MDRSRFDEARMGVEGERRANGFAAVTRKNGAPTLTLGGTVSLPAN